MFYECVLSSQIIRASGLIAKSGGPKLKETDRNAVRDADKNVMQTGAFLPFIYSLCFYLYSFYACVFTLSQNHIAKYWPGMWTAAFLHLQKYHIHGNYLKNGGWKQNTMGLSDNKQLTSQRN